MVLKLDRGLGSASAVVWTCFGLLLRIKVEPKGNTFAHQSVYVPTLTYGHELWVMTERAGFLIQEVEIGFLQRVASLYLRERVKNYPGRTPSRATAPPHGEDPIAVVQAFG